jgi:hypothetical protein
MYMFRAISCSSLGGQILLTLRLLMSYMYIYMYIYICVCIYIYIYRAPILDVSRSHTTTHHIRQDSSGRVIGSSQRPLPDNTQHSQQTNFHAPGGIRTHDLSRRAAADLSLRPRGRWDRQNVIDYRSNSYHVRVFLQLILIIYFTNYP